MDKPTRIKIGHLDYTIEWMDRDWSDQVGAFGTCHRDTNSIKIYESSANERIAETFIHEVYHALQDVFMCTKEIDTEQAAGIAGRGLVMVWRDNADVFKWWSSLIA